jgi:hypothetical protein
MSGATRKPQVGDHIWYYEVWSERRQAWLDTSWCSTGKRPTEHMIPNRKDRWRDGGVAPRTLFTMRVAL